MKVFLRQWFWFAFVLILKTAGAQTSSTGNWWIYTGSQPMNKKWNWHNEIQYRNYNAIGDLQQLLLRTGIGFNLSENNNNLLVGYAFIRSQNYIAGQNEKATVDEHRIFQQFITRQQFSRVFIQHRYRLEERFIEKDFQMRTRYLLGFNFPLNKKVMEKNAIYLSVYDELFINLQPSYFDRNRLYGALGWVIHKNLKLELGFMNQTLSSSSRNQFQVALFNTFPVFRKSE